MAECPGWESNPHSPVGPEGFKSQLDDDGRWYRVAPGRRDQAVRVRPNPLGAAGCCHLVSRSLAILLAVAPKRGRGARSRGENLTCFASRRYGAMGRSSNRHRLVALARTLHHEMRLSFSALHPSAFAQAWDHPHQSAPAEHLDHRSEARALALNTSGEHPTPRSGTHGFIAGSSLSDRSHALYEPLNGSVWRAIRPPRRAHHDQPNLAKA